MSEFFFNHKTQVINTIIVFGLLFFAQLIVRFLIRRSSSSKGKNIGRIRLIGRYVTVSFFLIAILIEAFILGINIEDIVVVFSSVFAVLGITLFANWSILSNVTSGIVMFFSFPYKIGDKIRIHDKDYEVQGIIEDIRSFQLHVRKDDGELITYPNNLMLQKAVSLIEKDAFNSNI